MNWFCIHCISNWSCAWSKASSNHVQMMILYKKCLIHWPKSNSYTLIQSMGLPQWLSNKEATYNVRDTGDVSWSLGGEDPLEEDMATHSGIPAWRISWIEKPGRLQSMGLQRVGHELKQLSTHTSGLWSLNIWEET